MPLGIGRNRPLKNERGRQLRRPFSVHVADGGSISGAGAGGVKSRDADGSSTCNFRSAAFSINAAETLGSLVALANPNSISARRTKYALPITWISPWYPSAPPTLRKNGAKVPTVAKSEHRNMSRTFSRIEAGGERMRDARFSPVSEHFQLDQCVWKCPLEETCPDRVG
jgi:hypothetical protein